MSLYEFIANLQRKPAASRKRALILALVLSFLVLSVFWVLIFKQRLKGVDVFSINPSTLPAGGKLPLQLSSPFSALTDGFKVFGADMKRQFDELLKSNRLKLLPSYPAGRVRPVQKLPMQN